jgi:hypothetical protein
MLTNRILLETFTPEQMQRYEVFRRANLNKSGVKKVLLPDYTTFFGNIGNEVVIESDFITVDSTEYCYCHFGVCKSFRGRDCRDGEGRTDVTGRRGSLATRTFERGLAII